jgi:predicted nucleic acid-binding protein
MTHLRGDPACEYMVLMTTAQFATITDQAIEQRVRDFQSSLSERVRSGEITDMQANELACEFQDRMVRCGPWG